MEADKNSSQISAYAPNSQPRIPTRACQGRVVTRDLPTLGTSLKQTPRESTTQEARDLAYQCGSRRTIGMDWADRLRDCSGLSENSPQTMLMVVKYLI
jgi:hypothetical protein